MNISLFFTKSVIINPFELVVSNTSFQLGSFTPAPATVVILTVYHKRLCFKLSIKIFALKSVSPFTIFLIITLFGTGLLCLRTAGLPFLDEERAGGPTSGNRRPFQLLAARKFETCDAGAPVECAAVLQVFSCIPKRAIVHGING